MVLLEIITRPSFFQPKLKADFFAHFLAIPGFLPENLIPDQNEQFLEDWLSLCLEKKLVIKDRMNRYGVTHWAPKLEIFARKKKKTNIYTEISFVDVV